MATTTLTEGMRRYRGLLQVPAVRPMVGWGLLARFPVGMTALALIFLVRGHGGSYAEAGAVGGAQALAVAVGAPIAGRLVDRRRPSTILMGYAVAFSLAAVLVVILASRNAPELALIGGAVVLGATMPPVAPTTRMLWPSLVDDHQLPTAFALEATMQELLFVAGPLVVGILTAAIASGAGLFAAGIATLIGVVGLVGTGAVRDHRRSEHAHSSFLAALSPALVQRIILFNVGYGLAIGAVEVTIPAFAELHGGREYGSFALAAWSCGSLVGGLVAAGIPSSHPSRRLRALVGLQMVMYLLPHLAQSVPELALVMFLCGIPIAPTFAITYGMVQRAALPGTQAEVFGWLSTSIVVGIALGTAVGGHLVTNSGVDTAFASALVGAVCAWGVTWLIARAARPE